MLTAIVHPACAKRSFAPVAPVAARSEPPASTPLPASPAPSQPWEDWRKSISRIRVPSSGCFKAYYPSTVWTSVPCTPIQTRPLPLIRLQKPSPTPDTVGSGTDFLVQTARPITQATGSFVSVTGVTSESEQGPSGQPVQNEFTLQLNSNYFSTSVCNGVHGPGGTPVQDCQGWQQFVYSSHVYQAAYIQYWIFWPPNVVGTCPSGWFQVANSCYRNSGMAIPAGPYTIADLAQLSLTGTVSTANDTVLIARSGEGVYAQASDSALGLAGQWRTGEFNIFGDGGRSLASFNLGATLVVRTVVEDGVTDAPSCIGPATIDAGTTAETNSLTLVPPCCPFGTPLPGIVFTESSATNAATPFTSSCGCKNAALSIVDGQCQNACGGTGALIGRPGASCGTCGHWTCSGPNSVTCASFTNVCGGCSSIPQASGAGFQPGEPCTCLNGATGRYYCSAKVLSCDCQR